MEEGTAAPPRWSMWSVGCGVSVIIIDSFAVTPSNIVVIIVVVEDNVVDEVAAALAVEMVVVVVFVEC